MTCTSNPTALCRAALVGVALCVLLAGGPLRAANPLNAELVKARRDCETERVLSVSVCGHREGKDARKAHAFVLEGDSWRMLAEATWQRFRRTQEPGLARIALRQLAHARGEYVAARELPPNHYTGRDSPPPGPLPDGWPMVWHEDADDPRAPLTARDPRPSRVPFPTRFSAPYPFENPAPRGLEALPEVWNRHDVVPLTEHGADRSWARDPFPHWP